MCSISHKAHFDYDLFKHGIRNRLVETRVEQGFNTSKDFAINKGLKVSTYGHHEAGTRAMSIAIVFRYASLLNVEPSWLLTGLGKKFNS